MLARTVLVIYIIYTQMRNRIYQAKRARIRDGIQEGDYDYATSAASRDQL